MPLPCPSHLSFRSCLPQVRHSLLFESAAGGGPPSIERTLFRRAGTDECHTTKIQNKDCRPTADDELLSNGWPRSCGGAISRRKSGAALCLRAACTGLTSYLLQQHHCRTVLKRYGQPATGCRWLLAPGPCSQPERALRNVWWSELVASLIWHDFGVTASGAIQGPV